jgi:hypothetical protein
MKKLLLYSCLASLLTTVIGCDETFNPNGPYQERMVVFAVLSTRSDTQYVRVHTTYPVSNDPMSVSTETRVPDAQVMIIQGRNEFLFRDTTLKRNDTLRYTTDINAYVSYLLHLEPNLPYELSVTSPSLGKVTSRAVSLYKGNMYIENPPRRHEPDADMVAVVTPVAPIRALIVRLYLDYDVLIGNVWARQRIEVPRDVRPETGEFVYPKPIPHGQPGTDRITFGLSAYGAILAQLDNQFPNGALRLVQAVFVLTELDDAFYAYYSTVNGFPDSGTIRLDEPDYTNIQGGFGVFGMSAETVVMVDLTQ